MMSPTSESKRNNRKSKKKRTVQTKENQPPKNGDKGETSVEMTKPSLDTSVALSQVVNKETCILCPKERPVVAHRGKSNVSFDVHSYNGACTSNGDAIPGAPQVVDKLPLWVCPECREKVEEDERRAEMESSLVDNDMLFQSASSVKSLLPEDVPEKDVCNCHVCAGKRHVVPGKTKELQELQFSWFEVKHFVRCVYREAGTTLADDDKLMSGSLDMDRIKRHTEILTTKDPHQLYDRLEAQTKEYLAEVRVGLIKFLSSSISNSPQHAKDCIMTLLDEYQSLCVASDTLKPFLAKLESSFLKRFELTWELINKKLFCHEIFNDPAIQGSLPSLLSQLRSGKSISSCGLPIPDKCVQDSQNNLLGRFEAFSLEMSSTSKLYQKVQLLKEKYINEKNLDDRGKNSDEDWDNPVENGKENDKEYCGCDHCAISSSPFSSSNELSEICSSLSTEQSCSHSSSQSPTYCSRHSHNGSCNHELGNISSNQLLPTALFFNRLSKSKCTACIREALHSFCFDQKNTPTKCQHHEDQAPSHDLHDESPEPFQISCQMCENHESLDFHCPFQHDPPETASSIQSLLLNGSAVEEKCRCLYCQKHNGCGGQDAEWAEDPEGLELCEGHEHRRATSPSISIPGNNVNLEGPPSSPSSVRSNGDGSSCDTPTSRSSQSEDGRPNNGKYCDCCYCELFGHGAPPSAQTSHNFVEMRERLRLRLKEKEKDKKYTDFPDNGKELDCSTDSRPVDELLQFINGGESSDVKSSSKAAKRQRQKMKKAAEKGNNVIEADEKGYCIIRPRMLKEQERPSVCEEKSTHGSEQKNQVRTQRCLETEWRNAKNFEKTTENDNIPNSRVFAFLDSLDNSDAVNQEIVHEHTVHMEKRKKKKEKQCAGNDASHARCEERYVIVNGQEAGRYVEHTRGARLPVREEAEPRHCGEECPPKEAPRGDNTPGKKAKGRKKKKCGTLDDVFLPKESATNGHSSVVDEAEREVEEFKRFCSIVPPASTRLKLPVTVNLKNLNLSMKKT